MSRIPKKLEWLVIIYDKPGCQRLKFRAQHLSKVPLGIDSGYVTSCGPIFKDAEKTEFAGSSFTIAAESKSEVLEFLKKDIYAHEQVWDFDNVVIHPYTPVYRQRQELPE